MVKTCTCCNKEKDITEFHEYRSDCRECKNKKSLDHYYANPDKQSKRVWRKKYNGTIEQEEHWATATQCDLCDAVFRNKMDKHQDHNHLTGELGAVLCSKCNMTEGKYKNNPEDLLLLYNYIKEKYQ